VASAEEVHALQQFLGAGKVNKGTWIDGTDEVQEGVWLSEGGEQLPYLPFTGGNPDGGKRENCIGVHAYGMFDISCNINGQVYQSLCEWV